MYSVNSKYIKSFSQKDVIWSLPTNKNEIFLTFDDGPIPILTDFILDELNKFSAKATFFCVGDNVRKYPEIYQRIINEGHAVGNHTFNHLNGWQTSIEKYVNNVNMCEPLIKSKLFRPPYGKIRPFQRIKIQANYFVIFWSVLPGDFDQSISSEKCFSRIVENTKEGSIIVFHDNQKTEKKIYTLLPQTLEYLASQGYIFSTITEQHCLNALEAQRLGRVVEFAKTILPKIN